MRGFVIGRFQPLHRGHLGLLTSIAGDVEEIVVGIGSAQASHTERNPFTAGERESFVNRSVEQVETRVFTVPIEDLDRYAVWVAHVQSMCPPFDVAYSNNPVVARLFREAGVEVRGVDPIKRDVYKGTYIRERMIGGERWRHLVPDPVVTVIDDIDGVGRIRAIHEGRSP